MTYVSLQISCSVSIILKVTYKRGCIIKKLKLPCQFQFDDQKYIVSYIRITLTLNVYQKSISNFYFPLQIHKVEPKSVPNAADQHSEPPNSLQNSLNGTSVFLEPHITVESSQGASGTKVTATAKFKLELHTPTEQQSHSSSGSSRPSSRSRSRRSSSSGSSSIAADALRSSGDSSLASSLSSDGGFSEK